MYIKMSKSARNPASGMGITGLPYSPLSFFKLKQTHRTTVAIAAKAKATPKIMASLTLYIREKCDNHGMAIPSFVIH
jgi:hypothetical protein